MRPSLSYRLGLCLPQEGALGSVWGGGFGVAELGFLSLLAGREQAAAHGRAGVQPLRTAPLLFFPCSCRCLAPALASTTCRAAEPSPIPGDMPPPWDLDATSGWRLCRFLLSQPNDPFPGQTFQQANHCLNKKKPHRHDRFG